MKPFLAALLVAVAPALAAAQSTPPAEQSRSAKPAPKKRHATSNSVKESNSVDGDPRLTLSAADLEVAKRVFVGDISCELGATVRITQHKREGFFLVSTGNQHFFMHPVESRTGAIRLEDRRAGAMWLQLANKSMLMSQKLGRRLADDCMSPAQVAVNEALKKNPMPSLLEPLPAAVGSQPGAPAGAPSQAASCAR
jgi:hypothetical protein